MAYQWSLNVMFLKVFLMAQKAFHNMMINGKNRIQCNRYSKIPNLQYREIERAIGRKRQIKRKSEINIP